MIPLKTAYLVSVRVQLWDRSQGIGNATLVTKNFVTSGYAPVGDNPVPADDEAKGKLTLTVTKLGPFGNPVQIYIDGVPQTASEWPLNVFNADPEEPSLEHNGPVSAGSYRFTLDYHEANMARETIEEWEEVYG